MMHKWNTIIKIRIWRSTFCELGFQVRTSKYTRYLYNTNDLLVSKFHKTVKMVHEEESSNKKNHSSNCSLFFSGTHSENHPFPHGTHESHIFSESDTTSINRTKYYNEMFEITSSFHNNLSHQCHTQSDLTQWKILCNNLQST